MPLFTQSKLMIYLIIALGFVGGYIYYSQSGDAEADIPILAIDLNDLEKLKDLRIDLSILDNPKYKALTVFGESPILPGNPGKKDLFGPPGSN